MKVFDVLQNLFAKGGSGVYEKANKEMFTRYCKQNSPDGEILFLAANPEMKAKGTGSFLLNEFTRREKGKNIYLYTDNAYTCAGFMNAGAFSVPEKKMSY